MSASNSPAHPSPKDYTPVPIEPIPERIDDGLNIPAEDADNEDDENLYTSSAPLLSSRSRDIGDREPRSSKWFHKMFHTWKPFQRDPYAWTPPNKKAWNWRKITFFTLIATVIGALIGLSISTAVLANKLRHTPSWWQCHQRDRWQRRSHLPLNAPYSANYQLNFVRLYPPLRASPNFACQAAWDSLGYVNCHEKIFTRSWDNGKFNLFDPEIGAYAESLCTSSCQREITRAYQIIKSQCTEDDVFDMTNYFGTFSLDPQLEDGPLGVITTIQNRLQHTCRPEPQHDRYRWRRAAKCARVMWDDWKVVDGVNGGNLEGIDNFMKRTRSYRREPAGSFSSSGGDTCDNLDLYSYYYRYSPERYVGPGVNTTTCGWCTINWFERKLMAWKKDEIKDPKSGKIVSLPTYLNRIKDAGERCEADAWDRIWLRALRKYKAEGDLDDNWGNDGGKKKPCKDEKAGADDATPLDIDSRPLFWNEMH